MAAQHHAHSSQPHFTSFIRRIVTLALAGLAILLCLTVLVVSIPSVRMIVVRTVLSIAGASPPHDENGYTNILLLGVGDKHHDGAGLTDTMMIASIDPKTRSIVLLSIPRDLYVSGNKHLADGRINTLYVLYKGQLRSRNRKASEAEISQSALLEVGDEMGRKLGIPIHGVIKGDFTAFTDTVDALGGVDVNNAKQITDYTYPLKEGVVGLFHLDAGPQHLDGETALKFARSRHSGTDFDRSARQQQLIQALAEKVQGMNRFQQISFVPSLLKIIVNHVETTMTTDQILGLTQIGTEVSSQNLITMQINYNSGGDAADAKAGGFIHSGDPALYEGADVLIPSILPGDPTGWKQIDTFVSFLINHRDVYLAKQHLQVLNVSANSLAAYRLQNELRRYGFILDPAPKVKVDPKAKKQKPITLAQSFMTFTQGNDKSTAAFFGGLLHMNISQTSATDATATGSSIRIVLGKDYKYAPFQMLAGTGALAQ